MSTVTIGERLGKIGFQTYHAEGRDRFMKPLESQ